MIIPLIAGLIRNTLYKMIQYFYKLYGRDEEAAMLKLIYLIMQQKQNEQMLQELIHLT